MWVSLLCVQVCEVLSWWIYLHLYLIQIPSQSFKCIQGFQLVYMLFDWALYHLCDFKSTHFVFYCFMQLYYEPYQGFGDDTAVRGMEVVCRGPAMFGTLTENIEQKTTWGSSELSSWSSTCPSGTAVCALKTQVEDDQGPGDDGALTDAKLYCCNYWAGLDLAKLWLK